MGTNVSHWNQLAGFRKVAGKAASVACALGIVSCPLPLPAQIKAQAPVPSPAGSLPGIQAVAPLADFPGGQVPQQH